MRPDVDVVINPTMDIYNTDLICIISRVGSQPRGRPRSERADVAILDAALHELIERGVAAISIEQVARRAGVTRATVYRRFPDKTQLLIAALQAAHGDPPASPQIESVDSLLTGWATVLADPRQRRLLRRLYNAADEDQQLAATYWQTYGRHRDDARRDLLAKAQRQQELPAEIDPDVVLDILNGAIWQHLISRSDNCTPADVEHFLRAVLDQIGYRRIPSSKSSARTSAGRRS